MGTAYLSRHGSFCKFVLLILASTMLAKAALAEEPAARELGSRDVVLIGDAACTKCHDEDNAYPVLSIGKTRHGVIADARTPTCTSCHGESEEHQAKVKSGEERASPDITYDDMHTAVPRAQRSDTELEFPASPAEKRNTACLACHQGGERIFWHDSSHANRDVACNNCHQVHVPTDRVREKETQTQLCFGCHKEQRAQMQKPSHHPVPEGLMACSDCHNPHGSAGTQQLARDSVNQTCYQCHAEKRGPFLHNHQPVSEDCSICHNPHGATIAGMLKSRPPFLCQECHSHDSHPAQAGALPTGRTGESRALGSVARGCLNCHTNIHGSNSSENSATAGRFRR